MSRDTTTWTRCDSSRTREWPGRDRRQRSRRTKCSEPRSLFGKYAVHLGAQVRNELGVLETSAAFPQFRESLLAEARAEGFFGGRHAFARPHPPSRPIDPSRIGCG